MLVMSSELYSLQQGHSQLSPQVHSTPSSQQPQQVQSSPHLQEEPATAQAKTAAGISPAKVRMIFFITLPFWIILVLSFPQIRVSNAYFEVV